ncbi:MAG: hypothetical protein IPI53_12125 [Saprospiraceae bacterium]|nr:hypothetical protein [Saprospiraceae bacterium]
MFTTLPCASRMVADAYSFITSVFKSKYMEFVVGLGKIVILETSSCLKHLFGFIDFRGMNYQSFRSGDVIPPVPKNSALEVGASPE